MDSSCDSPTTLMPRLMPEELCGGPDTLFVDCRPLASYDQSHIVDAVSLAFAPMQWRRILKQKSRPNCLDDFLMNSAKVLKRRHEAGVQVVLYDESTRDVGDCAEGTPLRELCEMLMLEKTTVFAFIQGGFKAVEAQRRELLVKGTPVVHACPSLQLNLPSPAWRDSLFLPVSFIWGFMAIGGECNAHDVGLLDRERITHILNLTPTPCLPAVIASGRTCHQIRLLDSQSQDLLSILPSAIDFIHSARMSGGRILVHCLAGISRSSAVAIAYVMWQGHLSLPEAYDVVRAHRQCASPNLNFMGQLMVFGKCLCSSLSSSSSSAFKRPRTARLGEGLGSSSSSSTLGDSTTTINSSGSGSEASDAGSSGSEAPSPTSPSPTSSTSSNGDADHHSLGSLSSGSSVVAMDADEILGTAAASAAAAAPLPLPAPHAHLLLQPSPFSLPGSSPNPHHPHYSQQHMLFGPAVGLSLLHGGGVGSGASTGFGAALASPPCSSVASPLASLPASVAASPTASHSMQFPLSGCTPAQAALLAAVCLRKGAAPLRGPPAPTSIMAEN